MYQYTDHSGISLHDCRAAGMTAENGVLRFLFAEGFYVLADNANNPHHALSYTDPSEAVFSINHRHMESYVTVYIYTDTDTENKSLREEISLAELLKMINGGAELEFLSAYQGDQSFLFHCRLWFNEEPHHKECERIISADEVTYKWNTLYPA